MQSDYRPDALLAEVVGTFALVFAATSIMVDDMAGGVVTHISVAEASSMAMEVILTFFLMFVILGVIGFLNAAPDAERINRQPSSGLAVGALPLALFAAEPLRYLWIYGIGPVGGALLAGPSVV